MIKEVIFDIDNTLYDYEPGHEQGMRRMSEYMQEQFGIEPAVFMQSYQRLNKECARRLGRDNAAIHSRSIRLQNVLEELGQPLFPHLKILYHLYWDTLLEVSRPEPGALEAVKCLSESGISIGIGTDMTVRMQYEKLEKLGFAPYVRHMVTSQEAGFEKPSRGFMELCLEKAGCAPGECVFVGDAFLKDVAGAVNAGMHAVWYNAKGKEKPGESGIGADAYHEIHHFSELVPCVMGLTQERGR